MKEMDGYEVVRQLGKGGMGTAYCVRRSDGDGGFLALKQVACRNTSEGNDALREAKTLQALTHKNVVRYHDVFLHMDAGLLQVCTVMEFCRSGDLAAHLAQLKSSGQSIDERKGLRWMQQLSDALAYLHSRRVVHRDLKPANVFLHLISRTDMALKVGDFGLSATLEAGKRTSRVGTPCYLAPEILYNEAYGEAVDIWGAGCVFYEMLTMDFLWERRGMLGASVQHEPVTSEWLPPTLSHGLRGLVAACLRFRGGSRPTAGLLSQNLKAAALGQPLAHVPPPPAQSDSDWAAPLMSLWSPLSDSIQTGMSEGLSNLSQIGSAPGGGGGALSLSSIFAPAPRGQRGDTSGSASARGRGADDEPGGLAPYDQL